MGFLPELHAVTQQRQVIGEFGGYDHNLRIAENEWYDMRNMSGDLYPLVTPRRQRARVRQLSKANGLYAHNRLCWVDGTDFYYDGKYKGKVTDSRKQFAGMGAYILIWPDKVAYNTTTDEFFPLGNKVTTTGDVTVSLCMLDGTPYAEYTVSDTAPEDPADGTLWLDTSGSPHVLKVYSTSAAMWTSVATTYLRIGCAGIGEGFAEYDGVSITGLPGDLDGDYILYGAGEDHLIITALLDETLTLSTAVTVERKVPDLDYITESENRLWGCSSANHEIYCCAQGDPKNWNRYLGISTDSYAMTVGSTGDFTGAATYLGSVIFFKEHVLHKIQGNKPSNYQLTNTNCRGVAKGSEGSLVICNETLYYRSRSDVCIYQGSLPASISQALGKEAYTNASAGAVGGKYYISMQDAQGASHLFVYDEARGLWHREDEVCAVDFAALDNELYYIDERDNCLWSVGGSIGAYGDAGARMEGAVEWMLQSGDIGLDSPDAKYVSRIQMRMSVEEGALVCVDVQYDGEDGWREMFRINPAVRRSYTVPIIPRRCDHMRLRLHGHGSFVLYTLTLNLEQGGDP